MNRTVMTCALVLSIGSFGACSDEEDDADDGGGGGTAGSTGGANSGASGAGTSGGSTSTGGASGTAGSSSGTSGAGRTGTAGSDAGGMGGDSGASGTAGESGAGMGGAGTGGAGGAGGAGGSGGSGTSGAGSGSGGGTGAHAMMNFFVTSNTSTTGNLGGLAMADMRCQTLAAAVGHGSKMWRAYLSVASPMTHAINRIGEGPYYNSTGAVVAADKAALHARMGDAAVFLDERGNRVNGQWQGSPTPNQHDILTGTQANGMLATGNTCSDWTATTGSAQVGHSDGLGPNMGMTGNLVIWNGSHTSPCGDLASTGGAGKLYCFVAP